jgi:hypothetical protein
MQYDMLLNNVFLSAIAECQGQCSIKSSKEGIYKFFCFIICRDAGVSEFGTSLIQLALGALHFGHVLSSIVTHYGPCV